MEHTLLFLPVLFSFQGLKTCRYFPEFKELFISLKSPDQLKVKLFLRSHVVCKAEYSLAHIIYIYNI